MCCNDKNRKCEHPEKLKGEPGDCSQEQIEECHGKDARHDCCK